MECKRKSWESSEKENKRPINATKSESRKRGNEHDLSSGVGSIAGPSNSKAPRNTLWNHTGEGRQEEGIIKREQIVHLRETITEEDFLRYKELSGGTSEMDVEENEGERLTEWDDYTSVMFDTETTGLDTSNDDIIQLACASENGDPLHSRYMFPRGSIDLGATRVHGISKAFIDGSRVLVKDGRPLADVASQKDGLREFIAFLKMHQSQSPKRLRLVAHYGDRFDFRLLINCLKRHNLMNEFISTGLVLLDSVKVIRASKKQEKSPLDSSFKKESLPALHGHLFGVPNDRPHDAQADACALAKVLMKIPKDMSTSVTINNFMKQMKHSQEVKNREFTLWGLPVSSSMKEKIAKSGMDFNKMRSVYKEGGERGLLTVLALPPQYSQLNVKGSKPRVTKTIRIINKIVSFFHMAAMSDKNSAT
ncbi:uncharacterized protein LOC5500056 isoform X3 [Nematostella vectensis]|uniref:uncharacterized protein LOC5500056 isoform X1 n=1 Tax=Nematostella vectensis TaxID=45351 RepID=UPI0020777387|nr:uncharacterized protein LOC5500056 isoform X1 [Nematostella vectensis]XP_048585980.1 uncharacterized protein LOC5500056 isoform X2 [Nematostella vectensis]XP_048585981.1 uncharacterized protein LOC5500056 isoform X3 [Nematostella vectensis]